MSLNRSFLKLSLCEPAFFKGFEFFSEVASLYWTRGTIGTDDFHPPSLLYFCSQQICICGRQGQKIFVKP